MTLEYLYNELKYVLKFFELNWNQKDEVDISFAQNAIVFRHGNREIRLALPALT